MRLSDAFLPLEEPKSSSREELENGGQERLENSSREKPENSSREKPENGGREESENGGREKPENGGREGSESGGWNALGEPGSPALECIALVLNINYGKNRELMEKCGKLSEYAQFVARMRKYMVGKTTAEERLAAVNAAVEECIREGILKNILVKNRAEVIEMCFWEYDMEYHLMCEKEESYKEGAESERARAEAAEKFRKAETTRADEAEKLRKAETIRADTAEKLRKADAIEAEKLRKAEAIRADEAEKLRKAEAIRADTAEQKNRELMEEILKLQEELKLYGKPVENERI